MIPVNFSPGYYPKSAVGRPVSNGTVYIGKPDLDPEIEANRKPVTALQEDGTQLEIPQPIDLNSGGVPTYNGSSIILMVDGVYSLKVLNSHGSQEYYFPLVGTEYQALNYGKDYVFDMFTGDGSTTDFTLSSSPSSEAAVLVTIGAVVQSSGYTISGTTLAFSEAPPDSTPIYARNLGYQVPVGNVLNTLDTISDLREHEADGTDHVQVLGYYVAGDGGGGPVRLWAGGQAPGYYVDNGGSIIVPTAGDGSGAWLFEAENEINVDYFGAVNDGGTTDNYAAITAAIDSASAGNTITLPSGPGGGYGSSLPITLPHSINLDMQNPLIYTGTSDVIALTIGDIDNYNLWVSLRVDVIRENQSDWLSESNIGVRFINTFNSEINLFQVRQFTIGAQLYSTKGVAYNNFTLNYLKDNKIQLDLYAATLGWVNENLFLGGRFGVSSTVNNTLDRTGVRFTSQADALGGYFYNNNNVFLKPSFEMNSAATGEAVGIEMLYGTQNKFIGCRDELNDLLVRYSNRSDRNNVNVSFGPGEFEDNSTYRDNFISTQNAEATHQDKGTEIYNSGPIHQTACYANGSTTINIPKVSLASSSSATVFYALGGLTFNADYIEVAGSTGVGTFISTRHSKRFTIRKDIETGYGGRVYVRCYDSGGTVLTDVDPGHPYANGQVFEPLTWTASFGGTYKTGADSDRDVFFSVTDDVAYVCVVIGGGSNPLRIRNISVDCMDEGSPSTWVGYDEIVPGVNIGTAAPTVGTWTTGRLIYDVTPNIDNRGWQCSAGGTPGTWFVIK